MEPAPVFLPGHRSLAGCSPWGWQRPKWATEHTTSTATLLIQAAIISYLVFCTNCLADFSASSLMPLCAN